MSEETLFRRKNNMSNTITIELCAEDRKRIDELIGFASLIASELKSREPVQTATAPQEAPEVEIEETPAPLDENVIMPEPEPVAPAEEPKPTVTHDMIRQKVTQLMAGTDAQKKAATRDIVKSYAPNVTKLPQDKWPEIWEKLTALEG
jgi:hypothetical protein